MKKIFLIALLQLFSSAYAQTFHEIGFFGEIVNAEYLNSDTLVIVANSSDYHVLFYSVSKKVVLDKFLRDGNGPNEAKKIDFASISEGSLFIKESNGQFSRLKLDTKEVEFEKIVLQDRIHFFHFYKDKIVASVKTFINPAKLDANSTIDVAFILDKLTFEISDTISVPYSTIDISKVDRIAKIKGLILNTNVLKDSDSTFFFSHEGSTRIIRFKKQTVLKSYPLDIPNLFQTHVVNNASYGFGIKTPPTFTKFYFYSRIPDSQKFGFSFGNSTLGIPYGFAEYSPELDKFNYVFFSNSDIPFTNDFCFSKKGDERDMIVYEKRFKNEGTLYIDR